VIAFDLVCQPAHHRFEGWFASSEDYDRQCERDLLACPVCGSKDVVKAVMAPNIGRKGNQRSTKSVESSPSNEIALSNQPQMPAEIAEAISKLAQMQNEMLKKSEWVGGRFVEEARAIHYGESEERSIHGEATVEDARALHEEGIGISPLPLPYIPPEAKN
jgi:hypothetical protein